MKIEAQGAALVLGLTAVTAQTVLLRTTIAELDGSEISMGILLAAWLVWTALGSAAGGWMAARLRHIKAMLALIECAMGIGLCLALWTVHLCRLRWAATPGELLAPDKVLLASLLCTSLFCLAAGACFAVLVRRARSTVAQAGKAAASVYLLEAAGSGAGGLLAGLALVRWLGPMQIAALMLAVNVTLAALLLARWTPLRVMAILSCGICATIWLTGWIAPRAASQMRASEWPGFTIADARESLYCSLTLIESSGMRSLYENGQLVANAPDPEAAEESVHFALLEHPAPRRVLLVGGAAEGAVAEALRHPSVERVDLVELDPALLRIVHERLKDVGRAVFHDHRVKVHVGDGRQFLSRSPEHWDAIVLVAPDPETAALNRFYTEEFFHAARVHLAPGGVFSLSARSSEESLSPDLREYLQSMKKTLDAVFSDVVAIPGDTMHFVAAAQSGVLTESPRILAERIEERKLGTQYVSEYFLPYRMSPERMAEARAQLQPAARTRINRDFAPLAYYENAVLWSGQFHSRFTQWLKRAAQVRIEWVLGVSTLLSLAGMLIGLQGKRAAALIAMGSTGFTMMAAQVFLLLGFQAVCGYLYQELALLVGLTMAGMALGSGWAMRRAGRIAPVQIALAALLPALMGAVALLARTENDAAAQLLFPALAAAAGLLGGIQFPRLAALWVGEDGRGAAALYAVDLIGGCAAALIVSAYLIPIFGFWPAAWTCALVGAGPAFATMRRY